MNNQAPHNPTRSVSLLTSPRTQQCCVCVCRALHYGICAHAITTPAYKRRAAPTAAGAASRPKVKAKAKTVKAVARAKSVAESAKMIGQSGAFAFAYRGLETLRAKHPDLIAKLTGKSIKAVRVSQCSMLRTCMARMFA